MSAGRDLKKTVFRQTLQGYTVSQFFATKNFCDAILTLLLRKTAFTK
jgi:hypothetical protein